MHTKPGRDIAGCPALRTHRRPSPPMGTTVGGCLPQLFRSLPQWLRYIWYAVGVAVVGACWATGDRHMRQAMLPPAEARAVWHTLRPRWRGGA
jgi:hypothetical protein